jgi:hypothetical protein
VELSQRREEEEKKKGEFQEATRIPRIAPEAVNQAVF